MAATNTHKDLGFANWLQAQLDAREWRQADLIRASSAQLQSGQLSRWLDGTAQPRMSTVRVICEALGLAPVEGMIAAGMLSADDVGATVIQRPDVRLLSNAELIAEVTRRMAEPRRDSGSDERSQMPVQKMYRNFEGTMHAVQANVGRRVDFADIGLAEGAILGQLKTSAVFAELTDNEGHRQLVEVDPASLGPEGEQWAARRRDEGDKQPKQG